MIGLPTEDTKQSGRSGNVLNVHSSGAYTTVCICQN